MGHRQLGQRQVVSVRIFLRVDEAHVEHVCHVCRKRLEASLCEGFAEADALTTGEWDVSEATSLFAARCQREWVVGVEAIGLEPIGALPVILVPMHPRKVYLEDISGFQLVHSDLGVFLECQERSVRNY